MLFWRLCIGIPIVLSVLGLSYLDVCISQYGIAKEIVWLPRGVVLLPIYMICLFFLTKEFLTILNAAGLKPRTSTVYIGNLLIAASCWLANVTQQYKLEILHETISKRGWQWASTASVCALLAVAAGIILSFAAEMRRYTAPGGVTINLAGAVFAIAYLGLLSCFMIQLHMAYEIGALLSLIVVAKMCDIGAFTIGKLFGKHKITPGLSPGKTLEGFIGGLIFACIGAWFWFAIALPCFNVYNHSNSAAEAVATLNPFTPKAQKVGKATPGLKTPARVYPDDETPMGFWLHFEKSPDDIYPPTPTLNWLFFGIAVALAGMVGDLAGSLIKRDTQLKDSGHTVPGFGGLLDIFDSLLMAAPVVYVFWALGIVCPGSHL